MDYRGLKLDFSNDKGAHEAATELLSWEDFPTTDMLVNNAVVMNIQERTSSEGGIEMQFAINYIEYFLLTC